MQMNVSGSCYDGSDTLVTNDQRLVRVGDRSFGLEVVEVAATDADLGYFDHHLPVPGLGLRALQSFDLEWGYTYGSAQCSPPWSFRLASVGGVPVPVLAGQLIQGGNDGRVQSHICGPEAGAQLIRTAGADEN